MSRDYFDPDCPVCNDERNAGQHWTHDPFREPEKHPFDEYCDRNGIQPGEESAAFAAFLHERTGWDGAVSELRDVVRSAQHPDDLVGLRVSVPVEREPWSADDVLPWPYPFACREPHCPRDHDHHGVHPAVDVRLRREDVMRCGQPEAAALSLVAAALAVPIVVGAVAVGRAVRWAFARR